MTTCWYCWKRVWPWQKKHVEPRGDQPQSMYDSFAHQPQFWKYLNTPDIYHQKCWDKREEEIRQRIEELHNGSTPRQKPKSTLSELS